MEKAASLNQARHAFLDSHITELLPGALPPYATTPAKYTIGILPFAYIFEALEVQWRNIEKLASPEEHPIVESFAKGQIDSLWRTQLLRKDLQHLHDILIDENASTCSQDSNDPPSQTPDLDLRETVIRECETYLSSDSNSFRTKITPAMHELSARNIVNRIKIVIPDNPHLLIAHIYIWYLAVLSGGRYLRIPLANAGAEFWNHKSPKDDIGFSFLRAEPNLKVQLKRQLSDWDDQLTEEQRVEVLEETERIYDMTVELVASINKLVLECDPPSNDQVLALVQEAHVAKERQQLRLTPLHQERLNQYGDLRLTKKPKVLTLQQAAFMVVSAIVFGGLYQVAFT